MRANLVILARFVILIQVLGLQTQVDGSVTTDAQRFRAVAVTAKPLRLTPKLQERITSEPVTGGVAMTNVRVHTGRWEWNPQALLAVHNGEQARTIKQIEFAAAIYDRARREQVEQRSLAKEVAIKPGKTENVELTIIARLPSDNLILLEIRKVIFSDGTSWVADTEYVLSGDMSRIERKQIGSGSGTLVLAQTSDSAPTLNKALEKELLEMGEEDQKYRAEWQAKITKMPASSRINPSDPSMALMKKQEEVDKKNLRRLNEIIKQYGWPGRSLVGERASQAAFLILQHADLSHQQRYLLMLKEAASKGEAMPSDVAMLEDRVLVGEGKEQIYGTQVHFGPETEGRWELYPILDEQKVDERRAAVGLPPLAEYLKVFGVEYRPPKKKP